MLSKFFEKSAQKLLILSIKASYARSLMNCWHCRAELDSFTAEKHSFRATCERCCSALHCCQNCKYYKPGLSNDCYIPETDRISDRTANNFCEEFSPLNKASPQKSHPTKERFDGLFKSN